MNHLIQSCRVRHTQSGFVLPLTLALIMALAFSLSLVLEQTANSRMRAALFTDVALQAFEDHAVEQEIVYRALLELHGRDHSNQTSDQPPYMGLVPTGNWQARSVPFMWTGVYGADPIEGSTDTTQMTHWVSVQDTSGLLDVNYSDPNYLTFLADYLEIPPSQRRRAVRDFRQLIQDSKWFGDKKTDRVDGLARASQLCQQPIWSRAALCKAPSDLTHYLTAREGRLPNYRTMPEYLKRQLIPDYESLDWLQGSMAWESLRRSLGFPGYLEAIGGELTHYMVTVSHPKDAFQKRFMLNVLYERHGRPYSIHDRIVETRDFEYPHVSMFSAR